MAISRLPSRRLVIVSLTVGASVQCAGHRGPSAALPPATPVIVFPFELRNNHLHIRALVNGDSVWLVLDTGAPRTTLDRSWALGIGALPIEKRPDPAHPSTRAWVDSIAIGNLRLRRFEVDLTHFDQVSANDGRLVRGLLGTDALIRYTVEIAPHERVIRLYDPAAYAAPPTGTTARLDMRRGSLVTRARLTTAKGHPLWANLVLDTGASRLCLIMNRSFYYHHDDRLASSPSIPAPLGVGIEGQLSGRVTRLTKVQVGTYVIEQPTVGLPDDSSVRVLDFPFDGVLGNRVLSRTGVVIDYARKRLIFAARVTPPDACSYDMSGLFLTASGDSLTGVRVAYVTPESPASDAQVQTGDEILAIDGRRVDDIGLENVREALTVEGARPNLVLMRGVDTVRVSLILRPLL